MLSLLGVCPLLANVAKVDVRATGAPNEAQAAVLKALLAATYASAELAVGSEHMTVRTDTPGSTVVEVAGAGLALTNEQIDGYWCTNDPLLRASFMETAVRNTGLTDVTSVLTCTGNSGEGCASSTPCDGGIGAGADSGSGYEGTEEPELASEPAGDGDGDGDAIAAAGIVLVVTGALAVAAVLLHICCPSFNALCASAPTPMVSSVPMVETAHALETRALASVHVEL